MTLALETHALNLIPGLLPVPWLNREAVVSETDVEELGFLEQLEIAHYVKDLDDLGPTSTARLQSSAPVSAGRTAAVSPSRPRRSIRRI